MTESILDITIKAHPYISSSTGYTISVISSLSYVSISLPKLYNTYSRRVCQVLKLELYLLL